jgi:RNA polymerase sigma-70 factor (ECF subfamily)
VDLTCIDALNDQGEARLILLPAAREDNNPEAAAARAELRRLLEQAIEQLPDPFRAAFVLRDIEERSVEEAAATSGCSPRWSRRACIAPDVC